MSDKKGYARLPGALTSGGSTSPLLTSSARGDIRGSTSDASVGGQKKILVIGESANTLVEILNFDKRKTPSITVPVFYSKSIEFIKNNIENDRIIEALTGNARSPAANDYISKLNEGTISYVEYPATESVPVVAQLFRLFAIANPLIPVRYAEKFLALAEVEGDERRANFLEFFNGLPPLTKNMLTPFLATVFQNIQYLIFKQQTAKKDEKKFLSDLFSNKIPNLTNLFIKSDLPAASTLCTWLFQEYVELFEKPTVKSAVIPLQTRVLYVQKPVFCIIPYFEFQFVFQQDGTLSIFHIDTFAFVRDFDTKISIPAKPVIHNHKLYMIDLEKNRLFKWDMLPLVQTSHSTYDGPVYEADVLTYIASDGKDKLFVAGNKIENFDTKASTTPLVGRMFNYLEVHGNNIWAFSGENCRKQSHLSIYDKETLQLVNELELSFLETTLPNKVYVSLADGNNIWLFGSCGEATNHGMIWIVDANTFELKEKISRHISQITGAVKLGSIIWTISDDNNIFLWHAHDFKFAGPVDTHHDDALKGIAFNLRSNGYYCWIGTPTKAKSNDCCTLSLVFVPKKYATAVTKMHIKPELSAECKQPYSNLMRENLVNVMQHEQKKYPGLGLDVPLIVERCANHILELGIDDEGLFRVPGTRTDIDKMCNEFNEGKGITCPFGNYSMPTIASLLKKYLRELVGTDAPPRIPLFTKALQEEFTNILEIQGDEEKSKKLYELMKRLPVFNHKLIRHLLFLLKQIAVNEHANLMGSSQLATVFAEMAGVFTEGNTQLDKDFLVWLLESYGYLFEEPVMRSQKRVFVRRFLVNTVTLRPGHQSKKRSINSLFEYGDYVISFCNAGNLIFWNKNTISHHLNFYELMNFTQSSNWKSPAQVPFLMREQGTLWIHDSTSKSICVFEIKSLLNKENSHREIPCEKLQYAKTMLEVNENEVWIGGNVFMIVTNDVITEPDTVDQSQNLVVEFFVKGDKVWVFRGTSLQIWDKNTKTMESEVTLSDLLGIKKCIQVACRIQGDAVLVAFENPTGAWIITDALKAEKVIDIPNVLSFSFNEIGNFLWTFSSEKPVINLFTKDFTFLCQLPNSHKDGIFAMIPIPYEKDGLSGWHVWSASKDRLINVYYVPTDYEQLVLDEIGGIEEFFVNPNPSSLTQSMRSNKKKVGSEKTKKSRHRSGSDAASTDSPKSDKKSKDKDKTKRSKSKSKKGSEEGSTRSLRAGSKSEKRPLQSPGRTKKSRALRDIPTIDEGTSTNSSNSLTVNPHQFGASSDSNMTTSEGGANSARSSGSQPTSSTTTPVRGKLLHIPALLQISVSDPSITTSEEQKSSEAKTNESSDSSSEESSSEEGPDNTTDASTTNGAAEGEPNEPKPEGNDETLEQTAEQQQQQQQQQQQTPSNPTSDEKHESDEPSQQLQQEVKSEPVVEETKTENAEGSEIAIGEATIEAEKESKEDESSSSSEESQAAEEKEQPVQDQLSAQGQGEEETAIEPAEHAPESVAETDSKPPTDEPATTDATENTEQGRDEDQQPEIDAQPSGDAQPTPESAVTEDSAQADAANDEEKNGEDAVGHSNADASAQTAVDEKPAENSEESESKKDETTDDVEQAS